MNLLGRMRHLRWKVLAVVGLIALLLGGWKFGVWWRQQIHQSAASYAPAASDSLPDGAGPRVVRGPYLQRQTPTGVVVRWRTNLPVEGAVVFKSAAGEATRTQSVAGPRTEHEIELSGLEPASRYVYSLKLGDASVAGPSRAWEFVTAPREPPEAPVRIWALGDSGTGSPAARAVLDGYMAYAQQKVPDVWLMLGDNAYNRGTDLEYQMAVFEMYRDVLARVCLWPTRGNHEKAPLFGRAPFFDIFTMPMQGEAGGVPSQSQSYYAFDYGDIHFVNLDSYDSDRGPNGPMVAWLKRDLASSHARWRIVYFHHPPYSHGSHNSDRERAMVQMRTNVVPVLEAAGVDLVLTGHSHSYERSGLISGHYGPSDTYAPKHELAAGGPGAVFKKHAGPNGGTVYVVAGASGELSKRYFGLKHPAMNVSAPTLGSLVLNVTRDKIEALYLTSKGEILDRFVLLAP